MQKSLKYVEELELDVEHISTENLAELAEFIEQCIRSELSKVLDKRMLGFVTSIEVEVVNKIINISVDLEVETYITRHISLENILDKVLDYVFTNARIYLSRFRKIEEKNIK